MSNQINLRKFIFGVMAGFIVLLVILAVAVPLTMSDGTENYKGAEREAAEAVMSYAPNLPDVPPDSSMGILRPA